MTVNNWGLPAERTGQPPPSDLVHRRTAAATAAQDVAPGARVLEQSAGGSDCLTVEPADGQATATVLYLHGGGYRLGSADGWTGFASRMAAGAGLRVLLVDYRLAPEHPYPAALHDATAAYTAAVNTHGPLLLGGDSAGGGLATALALAALRAAPVAPRALLLFSPWLDLAGRRPTYDSNAGSDQLFSRQSADEGAEQYLQGHDPADPLVSPLLAPAHDLAALPPTLLLAGGAEVLLGDTTAFAARAAEAGVAVQMHVVPGMQHVWPMVFPELPESVRALRVLGDFVHALPATTARN